MPRHITPPTAQELNYHSRLSSHHDTYSDAILQSCVSDNRATPSVRDNPPGPDSEAARTARIAALSRLYGVIVRRMAPTNGGWQGGGLHVAGSRTHGAKAQCEAGDGAFRRQCPATNNTGATLGDDLSRDVGVRRTVSMSDACRRWVYRHRLGLDVLPSNTSAMGHRRSTGGEEDAGWRGWWRGDGAEACGGVPHDRHPGRAQMLNEVTHDTASIVNRDQGVAQPTPGAGRIASSELLVLATNVECDTTRAMQAREAWTGPGRHVPTTHHSTHTCQPTTRSPFQRPRNNDDAVVDKILDQRTCACGPCVARHGCPATIRPTVACTVHSTTPVVGNGDFRRARSPSSDSIQVRDDDDDSVVTATTSRRQGVSAPTAPCRCSPPAMPYHGVLRRFAAVDTYSTQAHTYLVLASPGESNETRCSTASITDNTESRPTAPLQAAYCFGHDDDDGSVTRHGKPTVPSVSSISETGHGHDGQSGAPKSEPALPHHVPHAPSRLRRDQYDARLHLSRQHDDCAGVVASAEANVGAMSSKASEQVYSPSPSLDQDGGVAQTLRGSTPSQVLHDYAAAERQHVVQSVQKDLGETRRKFEATCIVAGADTGVIETSGRPSSSDTAGGASSVELQAAFYRGQCSTVAVWQEQEWRQLSAAEQEEWDDLQRHILCGLEQVAREAIMSELTMAAHENAAQLVMLYVRRRTDLVAQAAQAHDKLLHEEQDAFIALRLSAATLRASAAMDEAERVRAGAAQALLEQRETLVHLFEALYARRVNDLLASEADMRAVLQVCALTDLWLWVRAAVCEEQQLARDELSYRVAIERRAWLVPAASARVSPNTATVNHDVPPVIVAEETVSTSPNTVEVATEILERTSSAQRISTEGMTPVVPPASISCGSARDQPISTAQLLPPLLGVSAGETITVVVAVQSQEEKEGKSELPLAAGMQTGVEDVHRAVPSSEAEHDEGEAKEAEEDAEVEDEEDLTPTVFDNIVMKPHGPVSALIPQVKRPVRRDDRARHAARLVLIPPAEDEDSLFDQVDATWRHRETPSATLALRHRGHRPVPVDEPLRRVPPYRSRPKANWFEDSAA